MLNFAMGCCLHKESFDWTILLIILGLLMVYAFMLPTLTTNNKGK